MRFDAALDANIIDIIQNNIVKEQHDLQRILKFKGYNIPQATLSRHLKRLKISKVNGIYVIIEFINNNLPFVRCIQVSDSGLVVLHTYPGSANSLSYFIDQKYVECISGKKNLFGVLGTIAGDDTVLVILKNIDFVSEVLASLYLDFPYLKKA